MSINDKIKQILIDKNLSPSYFADEIGVQRSSISHILSGRNRPSFDIIQKIIRRFPDLGYEWIMEEEPHTNTFTSAPVSGYSNRARPQQVNPERADRYNSGSSSGPAAASYNLPTISTGVQRNELPPAPATPVDSQLVHEGTGNFPLESTSTAPSVDAKIERILIFFTDGSFKEYASARL